MPNPPRVRLDDPSKTQKPYQRRPEAGVPRLVMLIDGAFLALVGTAQMTLELVGHHLGAGPFGGVFDHSPYTIGWVEAHGLAALVGVHFLVAGALDRRPHWHGFALAVHLLLGGANLIFWSSFVTFGTVPLGMLATAVHVGFAIAQAWCLVVSWPRKRS
jgi:hypothetical protein